MKPQGISFAGVDSSRLAVALAGVAGRMEPKEATRCCAQAADRLLSGMASTPSPELAVGLAAVAARMEPKEAAHCCAQAADRLLQPMEGPVRYDTSVLRAVGEG